MKTRLSSKGQIVLPAELRREDEIQPGDQFEALVKTIECLPWDTASAREWARLVAELRRRGRAMLLFDSMIAATARVHGLVIVTRNVHDFAPSGLELLNPFPDGGQSDSVHEPGKKYGD